MKPSYTYNFIREEERNEIERLGQTTQQTSMKKHTQIKRYSTPKK